MSGAAYTVTRLSGIKKKLGYTSGERRFISTNKYDHLWDTSKVDFNETPLIKVGQRLSGSTTRATQIQMHAIVLQTLDQTKKIALALRGNTLHDTLKNISHYHQYNYRYKQDSSDREQIRDPARAFADRRAGIDCDCFSTSISSMLINLGIDHYWRKTKPSASEPDYSHIYVIVPKQKGLDLNVRSNYYVIDPVVTLKPFDWEHTENHVPPYHEDYHVTTQMPTGMGSILAFQPLANQQDSVKNFFKTAAFVALGIGGLLLITSKSK